jgi:hypothetical protein
MPMAICTECNFLLDHRQGRGFRLAECVCPACHKPGVMRKAKWTPDGYKLMDGASVHKGEKYGKCPVCGKKRLGGRRCWYHRDYDPARPDEAGQIPGSNSNSIGNAQIPF